MTEIAGLISEKYKHLLYKDECGDDFILCEFGEIFIREEGKLGMFIFSTDFFRRIYKRFPVKDYEVYLELDEGFTYYTTPIENLDSILSLSGRIRRLGVGTKKMAVLEQRLGHKVYPKKTLAVSQN